MVDALIGRQEGVLTPETRYGCPGGYSLGNGQMVSCHPHPSPLDLDGAIQISCNTYFCRVFRSIIDKKPFLTTRASFENWRKEVMSFGLGKKLGVDIPGELNGNIPSPAYYDKYHGKDRWKSLSIISLGIGQGEITLTPLQLANLAATISNRGWYYPPHIIRAVGHPDSLNTDFGKKQFCMVDKSYFDVVVEGMANVVTGGTAKLRRSTALIFAERQELHKTLMAKTIRCFIAFAPRAKCKDRHLGCCRKCRFRGRMG